MGCGLYLWLQEKNHDTQRPSQLPRILNRAQLMGTKDQPWEVCGTETWFWHQSLRCFLKSPEYKVKKVRGLHLFPLFFLYSACGKNTESSRWRLSIRRGIVLWVSQEMRRLQQVFLLHVITVYYKSPTTTYSVVRRIHYPLPMCNLYTYMNTPWASPEPQTPHKKHRGETVALGEDIGKRYCWTAWKSSKHSTR